MRDFIVKTLSSFFYIGYLPLIPGTFASAAAVGLFYLLRADSNLYILFTFGMLILGFLAAGKAEKISGRHDPRHIVCDEIAGMLLTLLNLLFIPHDFRLIVIAFLVFRFFDAVKPYPADALQNLKGSAGIMCDDLIAALYTTVALQIVLRFISFMAS